MAERVQPLMLEQARALEGVAAASSARDNLMVRLMLYTGCRVGELSALAVGDVDAVRGMVTFQRSTLQVRNLVALKEVTIHPRWVEKGRVKYGDPEEIMRPAYAANEKITVLLEDDRSFTGKRITGTPAEIMKWWEGKKRTSYVKQELVKEGLKSRHPPRDVPLRDGATLGAVREWQRDRQPEMFMFPSQKKGRVGTDHIETIVQNLMMKAGIPRVQAHPHNLRHTYAVAFLIKNPNALAQLAMMLGHMDKEGRPNPNMTAKYLRFAMAQLAHMVEGSLYGG